MAGSKGSISALGLVAAFCAVLVTGCTFAERAPAGTVRFQGALSELAGSGSVAGSVSVADGATLGPRALAGAAVNIAALPVAVGQLDVEAVEEVPVGEDGAFEVDVDVEGGDDAYVLLANTPGSGVGVEQTLGWLELPVGGEASTGWPVGATAGGTVVELGAMSGTGGRFAPGTSPEELYETLGVDQAELLFAAQRDNALKLLANSWLNRDAGFRGGTGQFVTAKLNGARDAWTTPETITLADDGQADGDQGYFGYFFSTDFYSDVWTWSDFSDGSNEFVFTPPDTVVPQDGGDLTFGPENPLGSALYWPNGGGLSGEEINGLSFVGPPVEGLWRLEINGELEATYDLGFGSLYDENGVFLYFLPFVRVNTDPDTDRIESFEIRFQVWDYELEQYVDLPLADVPVEWTASWSAAAEGVDPEDESHGDIGPGATTVPDAEIYWPTSESGERVWQVSLDYAIGELTIGFVFQPDWDTL